jgi:hypothetical protein
VLGFFFGFGAGLKRTTSHVMPAASAITEVMKRAIPNKPRTVSTEVG